MSSRVQSSLNRAKYAAIGAAIGAAVGGLFSRNAASTGGAVGGLVGAAVGDFQVTDVVDEAKEKVGVGET
ncbi:MAG: YMGG-like glycine zipper-containing protein [Halobacteriaceae archaeon]